MKVQTLIDTFNLKLTHPRFPLVRENCNLLVALGIHPIHAMSIAMAADKQSKALNANALVTAAFTNKKATKKDDESLDYASIVEKATLKKVAVGGEIKLCAGAAWYRKAALTQGFHASVLPTLSIAQQVMMESHKVATTEQMAAYVASDEKE